MRRESGISFDEVRTIFIRDNTDNSHRNDWPLGALEIANRQFEVWIRVLLTPPELLKVWLPWHVHGVELVPASGSTVSDAIGRLALLDRSGECYTRIQQFLNGIGPAVFLSTAPIRDPRYSDYKGLLDRGVTGLTHLDGLHRLIAWARDGNKEITAYVAGLT